MSGHAAKAARNSSRRFVIRIAVVLRPNPPRALTIRAECPDDQIHCRRTGDILLTARTAASETSEPHKRPGMARPRCANPRLCSPSVLRCPSDKCFMCSAMPLRRSLSRPVCFQDHRRLTLSLACGAPPRRSTRFQGVSMLVRPEPSQEAAPICSHKRHGQKSARLFPDWRKPSRAPAVSNQPRPCPNPARPRRDRRRPFRDRGAEARRAICCFLGKWQHHCLPASTVRQPPHDAALAAVSWILSAIVHRYKSNNVDTPRFAFPMRRCRRVERIARGVILGAISSTPRQ